jgi:hypothetical protein
VTLIFCLPTETDIPRSGAVILGNFFQHLNSINLTLVTTIKKLKLLRNTLSGPTKSDTRLIVIAEGKSIVEDPAMALQNLHEMIRNLSSYIKVNS